MRQVWELVRTLWAVGCIPIAALLLVLMVLCGFNVPFEQGVQWHILDHLIAFDLTSHLHRIRPSHCAAITGRERRDRSLA